MAKKTLSDNPLLTGIAKNQITQADQADQDRPQRGRPRDPKVLRKEDGAPSVQVGLPSHLRRFTAIVEMDNYNDLLDYAYTHRITIKDALNEIMEDFFTRYRKNSKNEPLLDHRERKARRNGK